MPSSQDLIKEFKSKNGVEVDGELIANVIRGLLTKNEDRKEREASIRKYVAEAAYPQIAEEFERARVKDALYHVSNSAANSLEFFEGYMNIISEIAKESSNRLVAQSNEEKESLKKEVEAARAAFREAKEKRDEAIENYKKRHGGSDKGIMDNDAYVRDFKKPADYAEIQLNGALERQSSFAAAVPFESFDPYFGMTAEMAKTLLKNQEKSATFTEMRRAQLEAMGPAYPAYLSEMQPAFKDDVKYADASEEQKRGMQEVYATKKLMQEQLENKTGGLFGWFWRLWYYKDIKAINTYIKKATDELSKAEFDAAAEAEADAAMEQGYFSKEYKDLDVEKALEEMRAKKNPKESDEKKIEEEKKEALNTEPQKPFKDQVFDVGFRPAKEEKALVAQIEETKTIAKLMKANLNVLPKDIVTVYSMNLKKINEVKRRMALDNSTKSNSMQTVDAAVDNIEKEMRAKISPDYQPKTFEEVKALSTVEPLEIPLDDKMTNEKVSKPVQDSPSLQKDPLTKNQ